MATSAVLSSPSSSLYDSSPSMSPLDIYGDLRQRNREPFETCDTITGKPRAFIRQYEFRTPPRERRPRLNSSRQELRNDPLGMRRPQNELVPTDQSTHSPRLKLGSTFLKENQETLSPPLRGESESPCGTQETTTNTTYTQKACKRKLGTLDTIPKNSFCYTCAKTVTESQFTEHLFFGEVKCTKCYRKLYSCRHYQEEKLNPATNTCQHNLVYCSKSIEYLSIKLQDDLPSNPSFEFDLHREMTSYISALKDLKRKDPWKHALHQCHEYLTGDTSRSRESSICRDVCQDELGVEGDFLLSHPYSLEHLDRAVEYQVAGYDSSECVGVRVPEVSGMRKVVRKEQFDATLSLSAPIKGNGVGPSNTFPNCTSNLLKNKEKMNSRVDNSSKKQTHKHSTKLKTTPTSDTLKANTPDSGTQIFLHIPEDGHYLVVHHAIEECPLCYTELCPSRMTLNYETFLITGVCTGCKLTIYIIFHPPDGSHSKVSIVHSSSKTKKRSGKQKPVERLRIRDFLKK